MRSVRLVVRRLDGDILGGLALLALLHVRYNQLAAGTDDPPAARAVSVQSLARSLNTPAETMRRCVARLIALGWVERVGSKGVVISERERAGGSVAALIGEIRNEFWILLSDLKALGFDFDLMDQAIEPGEAEEDATDVGQVVGSLPRSFASSSYPNADAIDRAILEFGLRIVEDGAVALRHDYILACVISAIIAANSSAYTYDREVAWLYGTEGSAPPEALRRAVTLAEIAQTIGLPYETTRRYVNKLVKLGLCVRDKRKLLLVPMALVDSQPVQTARVATVRRFVRVVGELRRVGFDFRAVGAEMRTSDAAEGKLARQSPSPG